MKGMQWKVVLAAIVLLVLLYLAFSAFIMPLSSAQSGTFEYRDFRWYCTLWSQNAYRGTSVVDNGQTMSMAGYCEKELGANAGSMPDCGSCEGDPKWEQCRNACRFKK